MWWKEFTSHVSPNTNIPNWTTFLYPGKEERSVHERSTLPNVLLLYCGIEIIIYPSQIVVTPFCGSCCLFTFCVEMSPNTSELSTTELPLLSAVHSLAEVLCPLPQWTVSEVGIIDHEHVKHHITWLSSCGSE